MTVVRPPSPTKPTFLSMRATLRQTLSTLRAKTILIVTFTLASLLFIIFILLRVFLLGSFVALEEHLVRTDVNRAKNVFIDNLQTLNTLNQSYAAWDDTYRFVSNRDTAYITNNWYDDYFDDAHIHFVVVANNAGQVVFSKGYDFNAKRALAVPRRFQQLNPSDPLLKHPSLTSSVNGVILLPDGPLLVASHPIITSQAKGPAHGSMILGRYLNEQEITRLSNTAHLSMTLVRLDQPTSPDTFQAFQTLQTQGGIAVQPSSETLIRGYTHLPDLDAGTGLLLRVEEPRAVYAQGLLEMRYFMICMLAAGIIFGVTILVLLERLIVARLSQLNTHVQYIGTQSDLSERVQTRGDDEISALAQAVNGMLASLERAQIERQEAATQHEQMHLQQENVRAKHELIAIVAHELRTPLTPIRGFADLLLYNSEELNEDQLLALQKIRSNAIRMSGIIEDLLDIGSLEAHKLSLNISPVPINAVITETIHLLDSEIKRKQIDLVYDVPSDLPLVQADRKRVGQIVTNLLSNAIKYTLAQGTVRIKACYDNPNEIEIRVEDAGIGLTPEQQQHLFERFYRADSALKHQEVGTGLGLSIAYKFVELHGGRMWVSSQINVGSVFAFTLPLCHTAPVPHQP